jgi:outer membrane scaffolding protein for murein synthesis (MipA/OmpV family)
MKKLLMAGVIFFFLAACNSGDSDRSASDTATMEGIDPSTGGGAGGNTNNIGTDTMRSITDTTRDTTRRDTSRRDTSGNR